jgi:hypothetical protein
MKVKLLIRLVSNIPTDFAKEVKDITRTVDIDDQETFVFEQVLKQLDDKTR